jgi:cytochrome c
MNRFNLHKIIPAIVLTVVIVLGIDKLANVVYQVKAPESTGFKVTVVSEKKETPKDNKTEAMDNLDIKSLLASGNIDHGKTVFKKCVACHSIKKGGGNKIGPALWGVIGRKTGALADYKYSKAMGGFNKTWNFETMNVFLIKPKDYIKGTKMAFAGLKNEKDRASVIVYLNEQSDSPLSLP